MSASGFVTSRRTLLSGLAASSVTAWPSIGVAPEGGLPFAATHEPVSLMRSREGRNLSRSRYHNAEEFFATVETGILSRRDDQLYHVGITLQDETRLVASRGPENRLRRMLETTMAR